MAKYRFSFSERLAIWEAYGRICLYCEEPISFRDFEADHVLPEDLLGQPDKLQALIKEYDLASDFSVNSFSNWAATHHKCNRRKSNNLASKSRALHFLQIAEQKGCDAKRRWEYYEKANNANKVLAKLRVLIENGEITRQEIVDFANAIVRDANVGLNNPLVVCFGLNFFELYQSDFLSERAPEPYDELCNWLEEELVNEIKTKLNCRFKIIESAENGETFSLRIAFSDLTLNELETLELGSWEILEVALHTEVYWEFVQKH